MTLPKKGSRLVEVKNVSYRWIVRSKPTYCQGAFASSMQFAVELANKPGTTLVVDIGQARPDNWLGRNFAVVTPQLVAASIEQALEQGWQPHKGGPSFFLSIQAPAIEQRHDQVELRPDF